VERSDVNPSNEEDVVGRADEGEDEEFEDIDEMDEDEDEGEEEGLGSDR
jgi:hypothetical protein